MVGGHRFKALAVSLLANQSADTRGCQASPEADLVQCPLHRLPSVLPQTIVPHSSGAAGSSRTIRNVRPCRLCSHIVTVSSGRDRPGSQFGQSASFKSSISCQLR